MEPAAGFDFQCQHFACRVFNEEIQLPHRLAGEIVWREPMGGQLLCDYILIDSAIIHASFCAKTVEYTEG